jgi:general secretion pathway protein G
VPAPPEELLGWGQAARFVTSRVTEYYLRAMTRRRSRRSQAGFTLIEILVASTILLILVSVSGFMVARYLGRARVIGARTQIDAFSLALSGYYIDAGRYPSTEQGLEALWRRPTLEPVPARWDGPYLEKELGPDPWGNGYVYVAPGPNNLPYEIRSRGADGVDGGSGADADIVSWRD